MYIKNLTIDSFGVLRSRSFTFGEGLNIVEGDNESGKSALAMFIKFMLYGLSGKAAGGELSERRRYVNWETGCAAGSMTVADGESETRIERTLSVSRSDDGARARESVRESVRMIDAASGTQIHRGEVPGEALFGVPEAIFLNTVFVRQIDGARPSGASVLSSIENLLFTADENVGTKKAVERLDDERKRILYKNGSGGELFEAKSERSAAAAALNEAQRAQKDRMSDEEKLAGLEETCAGLRAEIERQEKICADGEINLAKRRFDAVNASERKLETLRGELKERAVRGIDRAYLAQLDDCARRIAETTAALDKFEEASGALAARQKTEEARRKKIGAETENVLSRTESLRLRMRSMGAAAGTLLFFAVLAGAVGWLLSYFHISLFPVPLAFAGALAVLGIVCLILRGRASSEIADILREWGAADTGALGGAIADSMGGAPDGASLAAEKTRLDAAAADAREKRRAEIARGYTLARRAADCGEEPSDDARAAAQIASVLRQAKDAGARFVTETEALTRDADALEGRLSLLREQLAGTDENEVRRAFAENMRTVEGRIASGLDAVKLENARHSLADVKRKLRAAEDEWHSWELRLTAARAASASPAELAQKIDALDDRIETLSERHEAYCLAIETLEHASETMRTGVLPRIVAEASASANCISGGAFDAIGVDHDLAMTFTRGTQTREVGYLSEGTKDVAYISLRRALSGALFGGRRPPLIYDESFARVDEERLGRILAMLSAPDADGAQSIVLTCRRLEGELAAALPGVTRIRL